MNFSRSEHNFFSAGREYADVCLFSFGEYLIKTAASLVYTHARIINYGIYLIGVRNELAAKKYLAIKCAVASTPWSII
jgi:hypothetical protein